MTGRYTITGCGYTGLRLARRLFARGDRVLAMTRSPERSGSLQAEGMETVRVDLDLPGPLSLHHASGSVLYYLVPPPQQGNHDSRMAAFLSALSQWPAQGNTLPSKMILVSTSAVYGDCAGRWIDESEPARPGSDRGRRRLDAETRFRTFSEAHGIPWTILRVAGLYGPGKLPVARIRSGEPVLLLQHSPWSNRIHVDDLVRLLLAVGEVGEASATGVIHATDGHPTSMTDFFFRTADAMHIPRPPEISLEEAREKLGRGILSYLEESKRLSNGRMRELLGEELLYPDLDSGIAASLAEELQTAQGVN